MEKNPPPPYDDLPLYTPRPSHSERTPLLPRSRIAPPREQSHKASNHLLQFLFIGGCLLITGVFVCLKLFSSGYEKVPEKDPVRVAVVGAGPAGVSAAWALGNLKLRGGRRVDVTIFERRERVGGRMAGVEMGFDLEDVATGELVLSGSLLERRVREVLGLSLDEGESKNERNVGFWDGREVGVWLVRDMVAVLTRPVKEVSWVRYLKLLWRYGASVWRAKRLFDSDQEVEDMSQLVRTAEIRKLLSTGGEDMVNSAGIGEKYREEILQPQLKRQLGGQDLEKLSAFAVRRALAREDKPRQSPGGTFRKVLEKLMQKSKAALRLNTEVIGFKREEISEGKEEWILKGTGQEGSTYEHFDHVVLAGPWNSTGSLKDTEQEEIAYKSIRVTFILSDNKLPASEFDQKGQLADEILPIHGESHGGRSVAGVGIHEFSHIRTILHPEGPKHLYRIIHEFPFYKETLSLFNGSEIEMFEQEIEHAYPLLYPRSDGIGEFELGEGLWQTGVVERLGCEVGFAWWAGEKVGQLIGRRLMDEES